MAEWEIVSRAEANAAERRARSLSSESSSIIATTYESVGPSMSNPRSDDESSYGYSHVSDAVSETDDDEEYLQAARQAFEEGRIPSKTSQRIMQQVKKAGSSLNGLRMVAILRAEIDDGLIFTQAIDPAPTHGPREIILSAYLHNE